MDAPAYNKINAQQILHCIVLTCQDIFWLLYDWLSNKILTNKIEVVKFGHNTLKQ